MGYTISPLLGQFRDTFRIPPDQASPSQTHRCPGACGTFHILPRGIHGLCFGSFVSGPLPLRSLLQSPLSRVNFGESLIIRLYSEIDQIHLSSETQCVSHHLPPVDCRIHYLLRKVLLRKVNNFWVNFGLRGRVNEK